MITIIDWASNTGLKNFQTAGWFAFSYLYLPHKQRHGNQCGDGRGWSSVGPCLSPSNSVVPCQMSFDRRLRPYRRPVEWAAVLRDQFSSNFNCSRHNKLSRLARYFKSVDILTHEKVKAVLSAVLPSSESSFLYMRDTLGFSSSSFLGV